MEKVEFYFSKDGVSGSEVANTYEASTFDEATKLFHEEFPDEDKRPRVVRIRVEHLKG